jgi:hypothetical protein
MIAFRRNLKGEKCGRNAPSECDPGENLVVGTYYWGGF